MTETHRYILASKSPRRRALLEAWGMDFEVMETDVDERAIQAGSLRSFVMQAAAAKANAVRLALARPDDPRPIIAADTMVALKDEALGKPRDRDEARAMLRALSGQTHRVLTGLAISLSTEGLWLDAQETRVTFRELSDEAIALYLATGAGDDKAGAYGVQEVADQFIERVEGDLSNVIGLPLECLRRGLAEAAGDRRWYERSPREAVFKAFPEVASMARAIWSGVPD